MKKEYLNKLIREIKAIDPRIEEKPLPKRFGVTFSGPSADSEGRRVHKFFRIEDRTGDQFVGDYYSLVGQERVHDMGRIREVNRKTENLKVESIGFATGDDVSEIVASARKAFELVLERGR